MFEGETKMEKGRDRPEGNSIKKIVKQKGKRVKVWKGRETDRETVRQVIFSLTGQLSDSLLGPPDKRGQVRACKHTHIYTHPFNDCSLA